MSGRVLRSCLTGSAVLATVVATLAQAGAQPPTGGAPTRPGPPPPPVQGPQFRSDVDIVIVEATVVDRSGAIVKGLQPSDFRVRIGGKDREVVSAELVEYQTTASTPAAKNADITSNAGAQGRTIVIVIDQSSLESSSRGTLDGVKRWIATLPPADRVGLVALPPPGARVEFTTEHQRVIDAIGRVATTTATRPIPMGGKNVSLWESLRIADNDMTVLTDVIARECSGSDPLCRGDVEMSARDVSMDAQMRVQPVLGSLRGLMQGLAQLPGPKHMVLLTSGWPIDERNAPLELQGLATDASRSNVTVHSFTAEQWAMSASIGRPSPRMGMDSQMLVQSVELLAGFTGGKSARLVGTGELALKSLTDGLTGYYRLGVRPADVDLNGKTRRISVKLSREGASLKSYRRFMAGARPASETPAIDPATALRNAMKNPVPISDLDLRATAYVMHGADPAAGTLRVVIVSDVERAASGPAAAIVAIYDREGKPVAGGEMALDIDDSASSHRLQNALVVKPGAYMMKLAVRDTEGKIGTVERSVDVRWLKAGVAETTGPVLFRYRPGYRAPEPLLETLTTDDQLVTQLSLNTPDPAKASVTVDILKEGAPASLLTMRARLGQTSGGTLIAQQAAPMALLPPGRYTVSVAVEAGGRATFTRSFAVAAEAPPVDTGADELVEEGATPPPPRPPAPSLTAILSMARPSRFASTSVLDPAFVSPIIDRLASRPDTGSVRTALEGMRQGPWSAEARASLASSPLAASFVSGLGRLQSGDLEGAANDFRAALRTAPDFAPAMVYLGACYAAGSKDKEAASAWQTALLRERDASGVAALAIDAWLRAERNAAALALIKQARARWPADQTFVRQQAQALLADGKTREGLEIVAGITDPGESLLFVSLATLYYDLRAKKVVWDAARDRQTMRELRESYAKASGGSLALIDAWIAEVTAAQ
jgi:VWFA-related protein